MRPHRVLAAFLILLTIVIAAAAQDPRQAPLGPPQGEEFGTIPEWLQAFGSVVTALASLFLLYQVVLLKGQLTQGAEQLRQAKQQLESGIQWNKLNAAFTYFNSDVVLQKERELLHDHLLRWDSIYKIKRHL